MIRHTSSVTHPSSLGATPVFSQSKWIEPSFHHQQQTFLHKKAYKNGGIDVGE
jgi:hypothetical protein